MLPFRKILFAVDYSEPCQAIVPYVKETVRRFSADLSLAHAYSPNLLAYADHSIEDADLAYKAYIRERRRLQEFASDTFSGLHVETFAELGEPGSVIHDIVKRQGTDLVMLATRGRGLIRRFLLGSVAAKVLHDAGAAVWTSAGTALTDHAPQIPYKSVLCAVDETDEAETVLRAGAAFADRYQAQLRLVHVVETPPALEIDFGPYKQDLMNAADLRVRELIGRLGLDLPHTVVAGRIDCGVREEALRRKADLIIAGRGRVQGTFTRMWSHVYPIVRESPCPVLSI
jgi:nucleotide-binding universal stress UspA family protein